MMMVAYTLDRFTVLWITNIALDKRLHKSEHACPMWLAMSSDLARERFGKSNS